MTSQKGKPTGRKALGRGLSALISSSPVPVAPSAGQLAQRVSQGLAAEEQKSSGASSSEVVPFPASKKTDESANQKYPSSSAPKVTDDSLSSDPPVGFSDRVRYIPITAISNNPEQPRQNFKEEELEELSNSIKELGILQPALVRPIKGAEGSYEIVAGERRWRAAQRAGLSQLPVIIRDLSEQEVLEIAIVENVQRSDLSSLEEARAYQRLVDEFKLSQKEVAQKVGKDRSSVANTLRLLKLPEEIQTLLDSGKISTGHAKAILTVKEPKVQLSLAQKVLSEHLSVRALENIVSRVVVIDKPQPGENAQSRKRIVGGTSAFPEQVEKLRRRLGTKVAIKHHESGRGKIEIDYFSEAELDRVLDRICE
jgi:ParB family chromosome partitioning protein